MAYIGTTAPLPANGEYISQRFATNRSDNISGTVFADKPGTIYIEQSFDGQNWDLSTDYPVAANSGSGFSEPLWAPLVQIRYVNDGTAQTEFRLYARFTTSGEAT